MVSPAVNRIPRRRPGPSVKASRPYWEFNGDGQFPDLQPVAGFSVSPFDGQLHMSWPPFKVRPAKPGVLLFKAEPSRHSRLQTARILKPDTISRAATGWQGASGSEDAVPASKYTVS